MFSTNAKRILSVATVAFAAMTMAASSPAKAEDGSSVSRAVSLRGLDLSAPSDQTILRHRLMAAASAVCNEAGGSNMVEDASFCECRKAAFDTAWSQAQTLVAAATSRSLMAARANPAYVHAKSVMASAGTSTALADK